MLESDTDKIEVSRTTVLYIADDKQPLKKLVKFNSPKIKFLDVNHFFALLQTRVSCLGTEG